MGGSRVRGIQSRHAFTHPKTRTRGLYKGEGQQKAPRGRENGRKNKKKGKYKKKSLKRSKERPNANSPTYKTPILLLNFSQLSKLYLTFKNRRDIEAS